MLRHYSPKKKTLQKCPLSVSVSVLEGCLSYRELSDSEMTEKRLGLTPGVSLKEVYVERELTVVLQYPTSDCFSFSVKTRKNRAHSRLGL